MTPYQTMRERLAQVERELEEARKEIAQLSPAAEEYWRLITPGLQSERDRHYQEWLLDRVVEELQLTPEQRVRLWNALNPPVAFA